MNKKGHHQDKKVYQFIPFLNTLILCYFQYIFFTENMSVQLLWCLTTKKISLNPMKSMLQMQGMMGHVQIPVCTQQLCFFSPSSARSFQPLPMSVCSEYNFIFKSIHVWIIDFLHLGTCSRFILHLFVSELLTYTSQPRFSVTPSQLKSGEITNRIHWIKVVYSTEMYCKQIVYASSKEQQVFNIMGFSFL